MDTGSEDTAVDAESLNFLALYISKTLSVCGCITVPRDEVLHTALLTCMQQAISLVTKLVQAPGLCSAYMLANASGPYFCTRSDLTYSCIV